jgi:hypothetical protein
VWTEEKQTAYIIMLVRKRTRIHSPPSWWGVGGLDAYG